MLHSTFSRPGKTLQMRSNIKAVVTMALKLVLLASCLTLGAAQNAGVREVQYKSSEPLKLDCNSIVTKLGKIVKYEWRKDGEPIPLAYKGVLNDRDGSLHFQSPDADIEGLYQCHVTSDLGVASSELIRVKRIYINIPEIVKKTHTPVRGSPYQLECPQIDAYPKVPIAWMRQEKSGPLKHYLSERATTGPNNFLYFANVTDEDVNKDVKYVCATVQLATDKTVILAEHVIPELKSGARVDKAVAQYLSRDTVAKEGDITFLYCIYGGAVAQPDYFFEGKNVNGDNNPTDQRITRHSRSKGRRLLIRETRLSDQGRYTCKITDTDGSTKTHTMNLVVVSAPKFVKQVQTKTVAEEGQAQDVEILCHVKGVPLPKVTWTYNAKPLTGIPGRISVSTGVDAPTEPITSLLRIKGVQKKDAGYYGCKASNENGDIYAESLLSVA